VDYSKAEPYNASNINPACLCNRRLGSTQHFPKMDEDQSNSRRRKLSDEMYNYAWQKGQDFLTQSSPALARTSGDADLSADLLYVGDQTVSVLVLEDDELFSVMVTSDGTA
jgi:hypothetical protein